MAFLSWLGKQTVAWPEGTVKSHSKVSLSFLSFPWMTGEMGEAGAALHIASEDCESLLALAEEWQVVGLKSDLRVVFLDALWGCPPP